MAVQRASAPASIDRVTPDLEALFTARGWLAQVPEDFRRQILFMGRPIRIARGARIFSVDDPGGGIFGVIEGGIGIEGASPLHMLRIGHILRAGDWFGHHPILTGGSIRVQGMRAVEGSRLFHVPLPALRELVARDALAARCVGQMADIGSMLATRVILDLLIPQAPQRIAAVLLRVTGAEEGIEPTHPDGFLLSQADLGEMANVTRTHVNRVLGRLAAAGWIAKTYSRIRILDVAALRAFAASAA